MATLYQSARHTHVLRTGYKQDFYDKMSPAEQLAYYNERYQKNEQLRKDWAAFPEKIAKIDAIQAELKKSIAATKAKLR